MDGVAKTQKEHTNELFPRFVKVSLRGFISFFLFFPAIACVCIFDAAGSENGIALSMIVASFFLLAAMWYGIKAIFLFLKHSDVILFDNVAEAKKETFSDRSEKSATSAVSCVKEPGDIDVPGASSAAVDERTFPEIAEEPADDFFDEPEKELPPQEIVVRNKSIDRLVNLATIAGLIWLFS